MTVLVVAATKVEAAHVPSGVPLLVTGIGKTAAASAAARELAVRPEVSEVVNIGTAGALHDHMSGLHEVGRVLNHDISAEVLRTLGHDPREWLDVGNAPVRLASGDMFVTDPQVRERLARLADLVDMEGYAVAWAARAAGVPVRLVKHVSDNADADSMDWPDLVDASARVLGEWLASYLR